MCADECTSRQLRVSFARLLVEIDVTKPLPTSISVEGPDGEVMEQNVIYEWRPPFCSTCNKVGHDCAKKAPEKKKVSKKWVPKSKEADAEPVVTEAVPTAASNAGGGPEIVTAGQPLAVVPVTTPIPQTQHNSSEDGEWRVVARKRKSKGRRLVRPAIGSSNSYMVLIEEEPQIPEDDGDGKEQDHPNPSQ